MLKKVVSYGLISSMLLSATACGGDEPTTTTTEPKTETTETSSEEPTVIRFGTHHVASLDPFWTDPVTGEAGMSPEDQYAYEQAWNKVLEEHNVKLEFVEYSSNTIEELLRSVLANDPVAEIVFLWGGSQGTVLGQNVLQDITPYMDQVFTEEDSWMVAPQIFGKNYLLTAFSQHMTTWPLVFNVNMIEQVDALKENGETVYPTDLYMRGEWTWSKFEEYLQKIDAYYDGKMSPVRTDVPIKAFQTDYRFVASQAMHSNGQATYGDEGFQIDTPETIEAIEYIDRLMTNDLMMSARYGDDSVVPGWCWTGDDFGNGETVFSNIPNWLQTMASAKLAERGESMGLVPFPRPDDMAADDPNYENESRVRDSIAFLKGFDEETTILAMKVAKTYLTEYHLAKGNVETMAEFLPATAESEALAAGYDIFHEKIGNDLLEIFGSYCPAANEMSEMLGVEAYFVENIVGQSIYGFDGSPKFAVNVEQKKQNVYDQLSSMEAALNSTEIKDNIKPSVEKSGTIAVPKGTDPATYDWSQYYTLTDNVDGELDFANATVDYSKIDFNTIGKYEGDNSIKVTVKDSAGNEGDRSSSVTVYDPANTTAPVVVAKAEYRKIALDEDTSAINWGEDFIESATDTDGFDIKGQTTADVSDLDVTTAGTYDVVLTVTDYAGNVTTVTVPVTVE